MNILAIHLMENITSWSDGGKNNGAERSMLVAGGNLTNKDDMKHKTMITEKSLLKTLKRHCLQAFVMLSIFNFLQGCTPDSEVVIVSKRYLPKEDHGRFNQIPERWALFVERTNKTKFMFYSKLRIVYVDKRDYSKLKIGDTLANKY